MDTSHEATGRRWAAAIMCGLIAVLIAGAVFASPKDAPPPKDDLTGSALPSDRTRETKPFELAGPQSQTGQTTIPGDIRDLPQRTKEALRPPVTTSTSTTIPIPLGPEGDPICGMTRVIIEALRIITGPGGSSPANLRAGSQKFAEAADVADQSTLDVAALVQLTRKIAVELPAATTDLEAADIYNQLLSPTDPALLPIANEFGAHLQSSCPELLTLEP